MKKIALSLVVVLLAGIITCSVSQGAQSAGDSDAKGVSVYVEGIIASLDPYYTVEYTSWYVWNQVYETLVTVDETGNILPCLAKEYSVSGDGMTYSFVLEEGVLFHNGEELKASDVAFSINTAVNKPAMSAWTNMINRAEVTGDYTVDIHLNRLYAAFYSMVAQLPIVNEAFYSSQENSYDVGVGTGPYMYQPGMVNPNTEITCVRFDNYRKGPAAIPSVTFKIISDASTAVIQLETGELDFLMVYSVSNYAPLADSGNFNTALVEAPHTAYITMNNEREPLNNKALRQALNYATDRETITIVAYEGLAQPARMLSGASSFGVDFSDATDFGFNLDKAKEKLAEAGFPDGINFNDYGMELDYIPGSYHEKVAQCVQETWAQAGIIINLRASETYNTDCAVGTYTLCTQGGSYTTDMSFLATLYASTGINSSNYSRYSNARVDELFQQGDAITDQNQRKVIYKEICEIVIDDCPVIPIQHKQIPYVWNANLNAKVHPSNDHPWYVYEWSWKK